MVDKSAWYSGTICVDFDGTLFDFSEDGLPNVGPVRPGAAEALQKFRDAKLKINIYTCRPMTEESRAIITKALTDAGIPFDSINDMSHSLNSSKAIADVYIDDRAVPYLGNWDVTVDYVLDRLGIDRAETQSGCVEMEWVFDCPFCGGERTVAPITDVFPVIMRCKTCYGHIKMPRPVFDAE